MKRQIPPALFAAIIIICTFGIFGLITQLSPRPVLAGTRVENGDVLGDFSGKTSKGETFHLSDYKGKVVLLNFWATWCGPCVMEIPDLIKLQEKYGEKGFQIVGLSADDNLELAADFAKEHGINYPVLLVPTDGDSREALRPLGAISGLPTSILLDKNGKIVWRMEGISPAEKPFDVISNELKSLL